MAIDHDGARFLAAAARSGVDFRSTCTIGRQTLATDHAARDGRQPADELFVDLGARTIVALDVSPYEGASIVHDLNEPTLPAEVEDRYSAVVDGGTLEHIFDVPNALRTMMRMVAPGGHLLMINPTDGQSGHGFYQFSPELFYRALGPSSGFAVRACLLKEYGNRPWFSVPDPDDRKRRVLPKVRAETYLYVIAQRVDVTRPVLDVAPQQSDYVAAWAGGSAGMTGGTVDLARRLPRSAQRRLRAGRERALRWVGPRAAGLTVIDIDRLGSPRP